MQPQIAAETARKRARHGTRKQISGSGPTSAGCELLFDGGKNYARFCIFQQFQTVMLFLFPSGVREWASWLAVRFGQLISRRVTWF